MMLRRVHYTALAVVTLLIGVPFLLHSSAQEGAVTTPVAAPPAHTAFAAPELYDPAFGRYVDLILVGQAWDQLNPELLTDCALQLAEGERILMRSHKAISAEQLLSLAAKIAAEKRDLAALERLAKVAAATKNSGAAEQIATARKLAGVSRKAEPAISISAVESTPEQMALYQEAINGAKGAAAIADPTYFINLEAGLADQKCVLVTLSKSQREYLTKLISEIRPTLPKEPKSQLAETLMKLTDVSRQAPGGGMGQFNPQYGQQGQGNGNYGYQQYSGHQTGNASQYGYSRPNQGYPGYQGQNSGYQGYPAQPYQGQQPYSYQYQYQSGCQTPGQQYGQPGYCRPPCYSPTVYGRHGWCGTP